jgi:hypothetical protein
MLIHNPVGITPIRKNNLIVLSPEELTIFFVETPTEIIGYTNNFLIWKNPTDFF